MTSSLDPNLERVLSGLKERLASNLYSCCLYGSAVRGNFIEGVSDINLLIVLNESNPAAHHALAEVLGANNKIDPFILGRPGFGRSARAFASKFASIKRNYRVLFGPDPLAQIQIEPALERFLCEQALRNMRLRMVFAFVTRNRNSAYARFLVRSVTPLFIQISEVLRLNGVNVPKGFEERIGLMETQFGIDGTVLRKLLALKQENSKLSDAELAQWHQQLFPIVDSAVKWMEANWAGEK